MATVCSHCNTTTESHKLVTCSVCKKFFKFSCVDLTSSEARNINVKKGLTWSCPKCRQIGNDINDLKGLIVQLRDEIQCFKETRMQAPNLNSCQFEEIIQEIDQRQKRKKNVIIFGSSESGNSVTEMQGQDKQFVSEILVHSDIPDININDIQISRLGKPNSNKSRPLRLIMPNEKVVTSFIKSHQKIRRNQKFKKLTIASDKTHMEMEYYHSLKKELKRRQDAGEMNLVIKYRRGIPTIMELEASGSTQAQNLF